MTRSRSETGTKRTLTIDMSGFSLKSGWNSVYDFGKRIAGLAAFVCVAASLFPIWAPSQTPLEYELRSELKQQARQLKDLENVPVDIAVIREKVLTMDRRQVETQASLEAIRATAQYIVLGLLVWMAKEIFSYFGAVKLKRE